MWVAFTGDLRDSDVLRSRPAGVLSPAERSSPHRTARVLRRSRSHAVDSLHLELPSLRFFELFAAVLDLLAIEILQYSYLDSLLTGNVAVGLLFFLSSYVILSIIE